MKKCSKCKEIKSLDNFCKNKRSSDNTHWYCKNCQKEQRNKNRLVYNEYQRLYRMQNREKILEREKLNRKLSLDKVKNNKLMSRYKISLKEYNDMLLKQENKCKICNKIKELVVDHCHKTGKVRGLLCFKCNQGLGFLKDDAVLMDRAIKYIKEHNENFVQSE